VQAPPICSMKLTSVSAVQTNQRALPIETNVSTQDGNVNEASVSLQAGNEPRLPRIWRQSRVCAGDPELPTIKRNPTRLIVATKNIQTLRCHAQCGGDGQKGMSKMSIQRVPALKRGAHENSVHCCRFTKSGPDRSL